MGQRGPKPSGAQVLSIRIRPDIRQRLDELADETDRPLSSIINHQLQRALSEDETVERRFGNAENYRVMQVIGMAIDRAERDKGSGSWLDDAATFDLALAAIMEVLQQLRPGGRRDSGMAVETASELLAAQKNSTAVWAEIVEADSTPMLDRKRAIKKDLASHLEAPTMFTIRSEFQKRFNDRLRKLREMAGGRSEEWPTNSFIEQAKDEVEAEMQDEGKDPRLSEWEDFF